MQWRGRFVGAAQGIAGDGAGGGAGEEAFSRVGLALGVYIGAGERERVRVYFSWEEKRYRGRSEPAYRREGGTGSRQGVVAAGERVEGCKFQNFRDLSVN